MDSSRAFPRFLAALVTILLCAIASPPAAAQAPGSLTISNLAYVNWTSANAAARAAGGSIVISNLTVNVAYSGEIAAQTQISGGDTPWIPEATFLSTVISNLPPTSDLIALEGGSTLVNTLTFSEPIVDPILLLVSLGEPTSPVEFIFDQPFDILSQGPGPQGAGKLSERDGYVLEGAGGNGAIQFYGAISSISWTAPTAEPWSGFTLGAPNTPMPDHASSLLLLGLGLAVSLTGLYRVRGPQATA